MNMVSRYEDFLLESQLIQLINEGAVKASGNFLDKLKSMSKKNTIAKLLFDIFEDEIYISNNLPQNWIDTDAEDTVSFLSDIKADKIIDDNDESLYFTTKGRSSIKVGRFVKAFLSNADIKSELDRYVKSEFKLTDKAIEEFVNLYKSTSIDNSKKFKLVKGEDIPKWYAEDKYDSDRGTLGGSCMRDVESDYFDIYSENSKVCNLLIYFNENKKLLGRALIWKLKKSPCDAKYFMDRIYTSSDSDVLKFKQYADEQGWMYKHRQNSGFPEGLLFVYKGAHVFGKILVELEDGDFDSYPYLDTLTFIDEDKSLLSNVGFRDGMMLNDTDGNTDECDTCRGKGINRCYTCDDEGTIGCEECDGDGTIKCDCSKNIVGKITKAFKGCKKCKNDAGFVDCPECKGEGTVECPECHGDPEECEDCVGLESKAKDLILGGWNPEYKSAI